MSYTVKPVLSGHSGKGYTVKPVLSDHPDKGYTVKPVLSGHFDKGYTVKPVLSDHSDKGITVKPVLSGHCDHRLTSLRRQQCHHRFKITHTYNAHTTMMDNLSVVVSAFSGGYLRRPSQHALCV